jgi:glycosyltransferase involved in cell wall biosynthesis
MLWLAGAIVVNQDKKEESGGFCGKELARTPCLFSVIIPAIKARHLGEALRSLVKQTWRDFEIIVLDDAGSSSVTRVVSAIQDSRIIYRRFDLNVGAEYPSKTWNLALESARGEFVVLLGDDDCLAENYLEAMERLIRTSPGSDLYRARLRIIGPNGSTLLPEAPVPVVESWDEFLFRRTTVFYPQSTAEMCVRATAIRKLGGYADLPLALGSDDITWLRLALSSPVISTNETYACWRIHSGGLSHKGGAKAHRLAACENAQKIQLAMVCENEPLRISREDLMDAVKRFWGEHRRSINRSPLVETHVKLRLWRFFARILTSRGQSILYGWHMRRKLGTPKRAGSRKIGCLAS